MDLNIKDCQKIVIPEGAIYLGPSDKTRSVGFLFLEPNKELSLHNRPVAEELSQIEGNSVVVLYEKNSPVDKIILEVGKKIIISPNVFHQHINSEEIASLVYWEFNGDITQVIEMIKGEKNEKIWKKKK